jgi:acetylornithine deacetylase
MDINAVVNTLSRLVAFDTVSSHSNIELIQWVADRLAALGFETVVQPGSEPGKANLFATVGPAGKPGVMLAGHSDVVPVAGQQWTSDPFVLTRRDDRLYGRGSADMKGFIACVLEMAPRFAAAKLVQPIHIALSYNEETNMDGMRVLAKYLAQSPVRPAACVIGEPTSMQVVVANKGAAIFKCRVQGFSVHSSLRDQGVSAVEVAAEVICYVNRLQERLLGAGRNDGFEFPHTSVHVGRIEGGTAHNITARECTFLLEIRALPGVRAAELLAEIRTHCQQVILPPLLRISEECAIEFETIADTPGLDEGGNRALADAFMPLCGCHDPHRVSFGTEGGILQEIGVSTIVCGPGEIRVAHQPDEYVEIAQLEACMDFLEALCKRLETTPYQ